MNENLNLIDILKDCPKGTKLYSTVMGEVIFDRIDDNDELYPITIKSCKDIYGEDYGVTSDGRFISYLGGECILFPSKDQRDWSKFKVKKPKFDPKTLKPFEKILVRDTHDIRWMCALFSHERNSTFKYQTTAGAYVYCIPYNDDTKHLVGTTKEAPEFYRYWEI